VKGVGASLTVGLPKAAEPRLHCTDMNVVNWSR
jgi:hypothetical protein